MPPQSPPNWTSSESAAGDGAPAELVLGHTRPRLLTPPLITGPTGPCPCGDCALTSDTSYGYDVIDFADDVVALPLDEWEQLAVIHAGELLPDGRPRFRVVLILVARQNGKTTLAKVLIAYWLCIETVPLVLGTSTDRSYAKRTWNDVINLLKHNDDLREYISNIRLTIGEESLTTTDGAEYIFAANNDRAGRSTTLWRWLCDELRQHKTWAAWSSATNAMNAVPHGQVLAISNQGDDSAIVLDSLRDSALSYIETGAGDARLGLLEWSAPNGSRVTDPQALAAANPNLNRRVDLDALMGAAMRAERAGGIELAEFRTEVLCQRVTLLDPAIDPDLWEACGVDTPTDLAEHRRQVALCLDVSLDGSHATLAAAALVDGQVHLEIVKAWDGHGCTKALRAELPGVVAKVQPRVLGWFPAGPAAAVAAALAERRGRDRWPPRRVTVAEIKGDVAAVCMGLEEQVRTGDVVHPRDPMLTAHIGNSMPLRRGDAWVFTRRGAGPVDGAYAAAGAVHLARTLPPAPPPLTVA